HDCRTLPAQGSIGTLTDAFLALAKSHMQVPALFEGSSADLTDPSELTRVASLIRLSLDRLQQLDSLGGDLSWEEWVELFRRVLDETSIPIEADSHQGVQVLDAITGRGHNGRGV